MINKTLKDLLNEVSKDDEIYVYGAGVVAYYLARKLILDKRYVKAFVVSSKKGNVDNYFGIPVREMSEISQDDSHMIIGVLEDKQVEIITFLKNNGFDDLYVLTNDEYLDIRQESPDIPAEHFYWMRKLISDISYVQLTNINDSVQRIVNEKLAPMKYLHYYYLGRKDDERRYREEFEEFRRDNARFEKDLESLLHGLEEKSRLTVYQIVSRLHALCDDTTIVYNYSEKTQVENIWKEYRTDGNIFGYKLCENKYTRGGRHISACWTI